MLPESSSRPLPATLAQSRNLAHASLETAVQSISASHLQINSKVSSFMVQYWIQLDPIIYHITSLVH